MENAKFYRQIISDRLTELGVRMQGIETELDKLKPQDADERAVDLEDDEVLEGLGLAAQKEARLLRRALARLERGDYGTCKQCEAQISDARLRAVPYAVLCKDCASAAERGTR